MPDVPGAAAPESPSAMPPAGPAAAPMTNPSAQQGLRAQAVQALQLAIKLLESALLPFGAVSPEGKRILAAINSIAKVAGPSGGPDMNQAEVKMLAAKAGPENAPGGGPAGMPPMPGGGGGMPMMGPAPRGI